MHSRLADRRGVELVGGHGEIHRVERDSKARAARTAGEQRRERGGEPQ